MIRKTMSTDYMHVLACISVSEVSRDTFSVLKLFSCIYCKTTKRYYVPLEYPLTIVDVTFPLHSEDCCVSYEPYEYQDFIEAVLHQQGLR